MHITLVAAHVMVSAALAFLRADCILFARNALCPSLLHRHEYFTLAGSCLPAVCWLLQTVQSCIAGVFCLPFLVACAWVLLRQPCLAVVVQLPPCTVTAGMLVHVSLALCAGHLTMQQH